MKQITLFLPVFFISLTGFSQNIKTLNEYILYSQFPEAVQTAETLIKQFPDNAEIYYKCGLAYQMLNKNKEAENRIEKAYLLDSLNTNIINAYARISEINRSVNKAALLYKKSLLLDSSNFTALNNLSRLYFSERKYSEALKLYKILSKRDSLNPFYYRKIGLCKIKLKQTKEALEDYKKAYALDSTDNINIKSLASLYLKTKQFDKAGEICDAGIKKDSLFSDFYKIKGNIYFVKNHFYRAVPMYKKAISLGDSSYNIKKRLGMSLWDIKKYKEALPYNISVFKTDSTSYLNSLYLCRNYLGLKNYKESLKYAEKTLKLIRFAKVVSYDAYDEMATAYLGQKKYDKAIKMYLKRINTFENMTERFNLNDYFQIAKIYDEINDKQNALKYFKKVVKIIKTEPSFDKLNPLYIYANQRITKLKEDLFFEGR